MGFQTEVSYFPIRGCEFDDNEKSLAVAHEGGFSMFDLIDPNNIVKMYTNDREEFKYMLRCKRLANSALILYVKRQNRRRIVFYDFQNKKFVFELNMPSQIFDFKVIRNRLAVAIENEVLIYSLKPSVHFLYQVFSNKKTPAGRIIDLALGKTSILAYSPHFPKEYNLHGLVTIFNADIMKEQETIRAHHAPLAMFKLNKDGTKIATASIKGTIIRVFDTMTGGLLFEFARGYARNVSIKSLAFSPDSEFLVASSETETVHIFKCFNKPIYLQGDKLFGDPSNQQYFNNLAKAAIAYLPNELAKACGRMPEHAKIRLGSNDGNRNLVGIANDKHGLPSVYVITMEGTFYRYNLPFDGGECKLKGVIKINVEKGGERPFGLEYYPSDYHLQIKLPQTEAVVDEDENEYEII
uniref:WD_REPEATS_REGION domain-containing protein n=1 Tax=Rhabditophanes sp. KR3021 TaxID=114890 RepID=A0AC35TN81_9BILA